MFLLMAAAGAARPATPTAVKFAAAGHFGAIYVSKDGLNWDNQSVKGVTFGSTDIHGIVWGAGKFVAVTANSMVGYSVDGYNWTCSTIAGGHNFRSVAYMATAGKFIAVTSTTALFYSTDAVNWTQFATSVAPGNLYNWTSASSGKAVVYPNDSSGTKLFAVDSNNTPSTIASAGFGGLYNYLGSVAYLNDRWMCGGQAFKVSTAPADASTGLPTGWTLVRDQTTLTSSGIRAMTYDASRGMYIAVGSGTNSGNNGDAMINKTTNISSWPATPTSLASQLGTGVSINCVSISPSLGIGVVGTSQGAYYTTDWVTFTQAFNLGGDIFNVAVSS